jgi:hypothetical protein
MILSILLLMFQAPLASADVQAKTSQEFASRFLRSMEYIDYPDILVAIAANNGTPWTRYDDGDIQIYHTELEDRWNQAIAITPTGGGGDQLKQVHNILMPGVFGNVYRGVPIDNAGGDNAMDPRDAVHCTSPTDQANETICDENFGNNTFDRVTDSQLAALLANPLLMVLVKPDRLLGQHLMKYRYPSVATYKKFANQLDAQLLADIHTAEADPSHPLVYDANNPAVVSATFQSLTQRIIGELLDKAYVSTDTPAANYQRMIAVHPFDDYNGRSLRCWFRIKSGKPMLLLNFYDDLYSSVADFAKVIAISSQAYDMVSAATQRELAAHPTNAQFYQNVPEYFMYLGGMTTEPTDVHGFINRSDNWILHNPNPLYGPTGTEANAVDHKAFGQLVIDYRAYLKTTGDLQ